LPLLPSGRLAGIIAGHILEPGRPWFPCPDGHFWFETPDFAINAPPFERDQDVICSIVHAPVPQSPEEMARYIHIAEHYGEDSVLLTGRRLDCTEPPIGWSEEDWAVFDEWRKSEVVRRFLEQTIEQCRAQAEANRANPQLKVVKPGEDSTDARTQAALGQFVLFGRELVAIEREIGGGFRAGDERRAARIFARLKEIEATVAALLGEPLTCVAKGWHVSGMLSRLLKKPDAAERAFLEAVRMDPRSKWSWVELTRIRGERGDFGGSEVAARRAVELDERNSAAWANLAMTLLMLERRDEARNAALRALALDDTDAVAKNVMRRVVGEGG
jgi:tetratricopeptide (TPR) repeat protein